MCVQLLRINGDNDLEDLCADLMNHIHKIAADFHFLNASHSFEGKELNI